MDLNCMPKIINLNLFDIDGCVYHNPSSIKRNIAKGLISSNLPFLNTLKNQIIEAGYDKIILASGTNRQDFNTDFVNGMRSATSIPVLPLLQSYLGNYLSCDIVLDPFWMSDLYHSKEAGTQYKESIATLYNGQSATQHLASLFETYKILLIRTHAHRVASLNPDDEIIINFYDDRIDILNRIHSFFAKHSLPEKTTFKCLHYYGGKITQVGNDLIGTCRFDDHYDWTARYIAAQLCTNGQINTAEELKSFHEHIAYDFMREWELNAQFNFDMLEQFTQTEMPKLIPDCSITKTAAYTTADELCKKHHLPEMYNLSKEKSVYEIACEEAIKTINEEKLKFSAEHSLFASSHRRIKTVFASETLDSAGPSP